ncbi:MAG: helix-turn-helix transcriptional regulator [Spirochaetes bacterium]|nr:helix-turn-helix transcriptional regulator [Spirochaetota bacterium]
MAVTRRTHVTTERRSSQLLTVTPLFTNFSIIDVVDGIAFKPHQHQHYEIIYIGSGVYQTKLNTQPMTLEKGGLLIVKPGDWHEDTGERGLLYYSLGFQCLKAMSGGDVSMSIFAPDVKPAQQTFIDNAGVFSAIIKRMRDENAREDIASSQLQNACALSFFWEMVRALPQDVLAREFVDLSLLSGFRSRAVNLFQRNITHALSISAMAEALGMSESSFTHKCTAILGMPPMRAFMKCKIERAHLMLTQSDMSVGEVSDYLGFTNQYHFSRTFKRFWGKAPSALR